MKSKLECEREVDVRIGLQLKRQSGSHRTLSRDGWSDFAFAFHEGEELGPRMLARIASTPAFSQKTFNASS